MQAFINPTLALALLGAALALLAFGLRGVRLDRDPRCRDRRCRYLLRGLLNAKQDANTPLWPITCPECGREMREPASAKWGARRKRRRVIALAAVLALPPLGVLGFEGYAQWQSASAVSTMPMWLLLRQAERDSAANNWVHQQELLDRVRAGSVRGLEAERVAQRILRWQRDESVDMRLPGDAFSELHALSLVTNEQLKRFWAHTLMYDLVLPDRIEPGAAAAFALRVRYRAGESGAGLPRGFHGMFGAHDILYRTILTLERVAINGEEIDIDGGNIRLVVGAFLPRGADHAHFVLHPQDARWARITAPERAGGAVTIDITARWAAGAPGELRTIQITRTSEPRDVTLNRLLTDLGAPTSRTLSFRGTIPVALGAQRTIDDSNETRARLEAWAAAALLEVAPELEYDRGILLTFPSAPPPTAGAQTNPIAFAQMLIRRGDDAFEAHWVHARVLEQGNFSIVLGWEARARLHALVLDDPTGWELVITPLPELAANTPGNDAVLGGEPIVAPLRVELRDRGTTPIRAAPID